MCRGPPGGRPRTGSKNSRLLPQMISLFCSNFFSLLILFNSTLTIKISVPPVVEKATTNGKGHLPDEDYIPLIETLSC